MVDRGMSGAANLALIRGRGYRSIVACRQGERDGVYDDLTSEPGWTKVLREAHIFLCVLAYHLLVAIEYALRQQHDHRSWSTLRDQLRSHHMLTIVLPTTAGPTLRIRRPSKPEPVHSEIYTLLDLDPDTLPIRRSWDSL